ncbi:MAG: glucodextranase DOMON-like domain-containing protein [Candidatus Riflebacteria bacterium]
MKIIKQILVSIILLLPALPLAANDLPVNYFYERGALLDIIDNIGDDKGTGYYQYPADKRMRRGTFDIKRFSAYEEGNVVVFEIQMRNYIMRDWPDTRKSEDQGFVANLWDIYVDIDGIAESGYRMALPGRDVSFSDQNGWEKVIMISPLSELDMFSILRDKTEELEFQDQVEDIVYPDYVRVQRDKVIIKISKLKLPGLSERSGFQCLSMGYKRIISPNRLLNRDVKAFATQDDFGGGHDTYGDPPIIDMIVPENEDQYKLLRNFKSEPYRENIRYAEIPFVFKGGLRTSPGLVKTPVQNPVEPVPAPVVNQPVVTKPVKKPAPVKPKEPAVVEAPGFLPLEPVTRPEDLGFQPMPKAPEGFVPIKPVKKKK